MPAAEQWWHYCSKLLAALLRLCAVQELSICIALFAPHNCAHIQPKCYFLALLRLLLLQLLHHGAFMVLLHAAARVIFSCVDHALAVGQLLEATLAGINTPARWVRAQP